jgi:hypothetical protein
MYNLIKAAEAGYQGPVAQALDYLLVSNVELRQHPATAPPQTRVSEARSAV